MISIYSIDKAEEWDALVRSFEEYDVYYLSGYVKAFQLHGDGDPFLIYYESSELRAVNVVMKRDIAKVKKLEGVLKEGTYFDLTTPYGYGGWILEGASGRNELFEEYEKWCRQNNIVCEFVRYHPILKNHEYARTGYDVIALGETVAMDLSTPEVIWSNITSKNRNVIRKAKKNGVQIYTGRNPEIFKIFHKIYNGTMDKDCANEYYYFGDEFYDSILHDLPHNAQIFYAQLEDGTIIATSIMMMANGRMNYHLSGSLREYQHMAPSNLLLYEAALWGCANGYKTLHLGGGVGSGEDSLFKFKAAFYRQELCRYHIGKKIFLPEVYQELVNKCDMIENDKFFPLYRG